MTMVKRHYTAFSRQMHEAIIISDGPKDINLNSKSEWHGSRIPRLIIEVQDRVKQVDLNGEKLDKGKKTTNHPVSYQTKCNQLHPSSSPLLHVQPQNKKQKLASSTAVEWGGIGEWGQ